MKRMILFMFALTTLSTVLNAQWGVAYKKELPAMLTPRMTSQVLTGYNNKILALGGHTTGFALLNNAVAIDDTGSTWSYFTLADNRDNTGIVYLKDSTALLIGGMSSPLGVGQLATTERVYPHLLSSVAGPELRFPRTMANGIQLSDGRVLVAGCWYSETAANVGEIIDLQTNQVTFTGTLNQARAYPTFVPTSTGGAIMFGGWGVFGGEFSGTVEEYNPFTNTFTKIRDNLFADDPDFRVVTDFGDDMQHKTWLQGKKIFLARKFQNGTGWRLFTVDPVTKAFEVLPVYLPVADTVTGKIFTYLPPIVYEGWQVMLPMLWSDDQGLTHIDLMYGDPSSMLYKANSSATVSYWPYYSARAPYKNSNFESAIIFIGGNQTSNFDPVADAFVLVLNDFADINDPSDVPAEFSLEQNYPNPFNPSTVIKFSLKNQGSAKLTLFDVTGKEIRVIADGFFGAGSNSVNFDAHGLTSGVYFYTLASNGNCITKKMTIIK